MGHGDDPFAGITRGARGYSRFANGIGQAARSTEKGLSNLFGLGGSRFGLGGFHLGESRYHNARARSNYSELGDLVSEDWLDSYIRHREGQYGFDPYSNAYGVTPFNNRGGRGRYSSSRRQPQVGPDTHMDDPAGFIAGTLEQRGRGLDDNYIFSDPPALRGALDRARALPEIQAYFSGDASSASYAEVLGAWQELLYRENPTFEKFSPAQLLSTLNTRLEGFENTQRYARSEPAARRTQPSTPAIALSDDELPPFSVKQLETALSEGGFFRGSIDGRFTKGELAALEEAMVAYNESHDTPISKAFVYTPDGTSFRPDHNLLKFVFGAARGGREYS